MVESGVGERIGSGVMSGEVAKSNNGAHNNENDNRLRSSNSVLAFGAIAHSFAVLGFD